jgi:hypothetical protein
MSNEVTPTEHRRAAEQRAGEVRAGVFVAGGIEQALREFGETGILELHSEPIRAGVLDEAKEAVCSDRNGDYGEPIDNFGRWAGCCNALGYRGPGGRDLKPHDLAIIMGVGKFSRAMETPKKRDHGVDVAGYGSLMTELAIQED